MPLSGTFKAAAKARQMEPTEYAIEIIRAYGSIANASRKTGFARWTIKRYLDQAGYHVVTTPIYRAEIEPK